jgi:hypothetical protein
MNISEPSKRSLIIELKFNDLSLATATGFIVLKNLTPYLITNKHNFTGRNIYTGETLSQNGAIPNQVVIHHHKRNEIGEWITKTQPILTDTYEPLWLEHPEFPEKIDVAALKLNDLTDIEVYPYLNEEEANIDVSPSEIISVVGFPFGLTSGGKFPIFSTGFIATEFYLNHNDLPLFLVDCRSRKGQSGSAVLAYRGSGSYGMEGGNFVAFAPKKIRFLGIYSGRIHSESDLGRVWKPDVITKILDQD